MVSIKTLSLPFTTIVQSSSFVICTCVISASRKRWLMSQPLIAIGNLHLQSHVIRQYDRSSRILHAETLYRISVRKWLLSSINRSNSEMAAPADYLDVSDLKN